MKMKAMKPEFEQLVYQQQDLASGLYSLQHLLEVLEHTPEQISMERLAKLIGVIAYASEKRAEDIYQLLLEADK